jgi:hypothetical protein
MSRSTQEVKPDPGPPEGKHERQRWSMGKKIGPFAVVAAVGLAAVASTILGALGGQNASTSAEETPASPAGASAEAQQGVAVNDQTFVDSINECVHLLLTRQEVESSLGGRAADPAPWKPAVPPTFPAAQVESWGGVVFGCEYVSVGGGGGQVVISAYTADRPPPLGRSRAVEGLGDEAEFSPYGNGDEHVVGPEGATSIIQVRSGDLILRLNGRIFDIAGSGAGDGLPLLRHLAEDALTNLDEGAPANGATTTVSGPFFLDLRTGKRTALADNLAGGESYVASPDGTRLVYNTCRDGGCHGADVMTVANIDGTDARTLQSPQGLNDYGARWSPDGTKLVYQGRNPAAPHSVGNLFVQDLSSGRRTQLTDFERSRAWWFLSPSFSPDGRNVIFHLPRGSSRTTKWDVWSVPVTGGEPTLVLRNAAFPMLNPYPGPEGIAIQFVLPMASNFAGQSIMTGRPIPDSDIRGTVVAAKDSIRWPTVASDGDRIAYQDGGSIYVVDIRTGESSQVADGETAEWLDDDTLIVNPG